MAELISYKTVKIRKPHTCFGCLKQFDVGDSVEKYNISHDGMLYSVYMCCECDEYATNSMPDEDFFEGDVGKLRGVIIQ